MVTGVSCKMDHILGLSQAIHASFLREFMSVTFISTAENDFINFPVYGTIGLSDDYNKITLQYNTIQ